MFELPSYVKDIGDVLSKIMDLVFLVEIILVGIDVESLYTSIPHEWGIAAVFHFLDARFLVLGAQNEFVIEHLELALKNNFFQFTGSYFQQIKGTAMGAPCLHLGWWEEEVVYASSM